MTNWAISHIIRFMSVLLDEIIKFCGRNQMAESTFGNKSVNDGKLVHRLKSGRRIWPETEEKIRGFMSSYKPTDTIQ